MIAKDCTLFLDSFGRLYFDQCSTPQEHMLREIPSNQERRTCRVYLEDVLREFIGVTGKFKISVKIQKVWTDVTLFNQVGGDYE